MTFRLIALLFALVPYIVMAEPLFAMPDGSKVGDPSLIADKPAKDAAEWLAAMSQRLEPRLPDREARLVLLKTVYYEARRAGLDTQLVLSVIEVASGFQQYHVADSGARGYMQVMPYWQERIGEASQNLFHLRTNLRYGCTILRHYLELENGDVTRAVIRYAQMTRGQEDPVAAGAAIDVAALDFAAAVQRQSKEFFGWRHGGNEVR